MGNGAVRYFEDLTIGEEYVSPGRTVTETDVVNLAGLSGDWDPLCTDRVYALESGFPRQPAQDLIGPIFGSGLGFRVAAPPLSVLAFMALEWTFYSPIWVGDTIRVRTRVVAKREMRNMEGGIVIEAREILNQRGETIQEGRGTILVERRQKRSNAKRRT